MGRAFPTIILEYCKMGSNDGKNDDSVGINIEKEREEDRLHEFLQWLDKALYGSDVDVKHTSCVQHNKNDTMAYSVRTNQNGGMTRSFPSREERAKMVYSTVKERGTYLMAAFAHSSTLSGVEIDQMHVRNDPPRVNVVQTSVPAEAMQSSNAITAQDRVGITGLSDKQWHTLVNMLNEKR
ncbi:hypothetical protein YC2023_065881 [Brassica napus]